MILGSNHKFFFFLFLTFLIFNSCKKLNNQVIISGNTMGTTYSIKINDFIHDKSQIKIQIDSLLQNINNHFSTYDKRSEISLINSSSKIANKVSKTFSHLLEKSLLFCNISNGFYDITISPLVKIWGFDNFHKDNIPSVNIIEKTIKNIGYTNITIEGEMLIRKNKNIKLDFNSIAKGYAVDEVFNFLKDLNYKSFLIEIGGEVRTMDNDWVIGIQNPISNDVIYKIALKNMSMATSGTYNNNFTYNNKTYAHILNPKTGYPFKYKPISATIIADNCTDADAFATMALTWKSIDFINLIDNTKNVECYIVEIVDNKKIDYKSAKFDDYIIE